MGEEERGERKRRGEEGGGEGRGKGEEEGGGKGGGGRWKESVVFVVVWGECGRAQVGGDSPAHSKHTYSLATPPMLCLSHLWRWRDLWPWGEKCAPFGGVCSVRSVSSGHLLADTGSDDDDR